MKQVTVCISGGHLTPAIAVIEEIRRQKLPWKIVFAGRRTAHEERLVRALGVPFYALTTGKWGFSFWKLPIGLIGALILLLSYRPSVVLAFGGYVALPVAIAARFLGMPVITHEQTESLGLTNRIIALFARRVLQAREIGIPIRLELFTPPKRPSFSLDLSKPILYVTGGSTGARSLNAFLFPIVYQLVKTYTVIHQTGAIDISNTPDGHGSSYIAAEYFDAVDLAWIYHHAVLLIGRSGANTTAEAAALGIPALFVPLPWAAGDEQMKNAQKLVGQGMAVVLDQKTLTPELLRSRIEEVMRSIGHYKKHAQAIAQQYPRDAAKKIVEELAKL